jgi:hypothetical protein
MISPKGIKVQIPEGRVKDHLAKGFVLIDKSWSPSYAKKAPVTNAYSGFSEVIVPKPLKELQEELAQVNDNLEVTEI